MTAKADISGYRYNNANTSAAHAYLVPALRKELAALGEVAPKRLFELGCGNGSVANILSGDGWDVTGVDPSQEGIAQAKASFPHLRLETGSAYDDLASRFGRFPVVTSLEVVEHVYAPRDYARCLFDLLGGGGRQSSRPLITDT